ncbi:transposase [Nonomuraea sp. NPDC046802]|uniref:transposase n=1 Tax=Nonomuraea sp. NPDC046802 TaxID=3154919 RepID=UPI0033D007D6
MLEVFEGCELIVNGHGWRVEQLEPYCGKVVLRPVGEPGGPARHTTLRALMHHPDCRTSTRSLPQVPASGRGRQPATLKDLTEPQRRLVELRLAHLLEVETGYRGGDPFRPGPDEPLPAYDPVLVPRLTDRRKAKVAELRALRERESEHARLLGLEKVSLRTLERWASRYRRWGLVGCADDRWLRECTGRRISEPVREAIYAVRAECLHASRISMASRERKIHQYVREKYGDDVPIPCSETLRLVWLEWFGPGGARQRYARSAARAQANVTGEHVVIHRPGQVVALDTTPLPVLVRESVFSEPVEAHLTLALDAYTHSLVAFRITLVSEKSVDVAMLLRDVMTPLPMRADWGADMAWPYPGIPGTLVAELAGYEVAGLPFFPIETVTTDHGSVYKNHHLVEVQRVIGANIVPSRVMRPTDKQACERAFGAIQSLLFEQLPGFRGVDVADRGLDPEGDAVLTLAEMEHLVARWIVQIWQNRRFGEHGPCWDPGGDHSPNTLFAAAMAQGGFSLEIPRPELYYELLQIHNVKIDNSRGVKIRGLWYDGPALANLRGALSRRGGKHRRSWVIRSDRRDARTVFFQDLEHRWHELRWTGLPAEGEIPSFNDARITDLLREAKAQGLRPKTDAELLPLLLKLLGGHIPVDQWPTQLSKKQKKEQAREVAQSVAAAEDRPAVTDFRETALGDTACHADLGSVVPLRVSDRASRVLTAVDDERRQRRERAVAQRPVAPGGLGERLRRTSMLLIPDNDADDDDGGSGDEAGDGADSASRLGEAR